MEHGGRLAAAVLYEAHDVGYIRYTYMYGIYSGLARLMLPAPAMFGDHGGRLADEDDDSASCRGRASPITKHLLLRRRFMTR